MLKVVLMKNPRIHKILYDWMNVLSHTSFIKRGIEKLNMDLAVTKKMSFKAEIYEIPQV